MSFDGMLEQAKQDGVTAVSWCTFCRKEIAEGEVTLEFNDDLISVPIGPKCLKIASPPPGPLSLG